MSVSIKKGRNAKVFMCSTKHNRLLGLFVEVFSMEIRHLKLPNETPLMKPRRIQGRGARWMKRVRRSGDRFRTLVLSDKQVLREKRISELRKSGMARRKARKAAWAESKPK